MDETKLRMWWRRSRTEVSSEVLRNPRAMGVLFTRINSGSLIIRENGRRHRIAMASPDAADLVVWMGYRMLWSETRSTTGHERPDQMPFERLMRAEEHAYTITQEAESVTETIEHRVVGSELAFFLGERRFNHVRPFLGMPLGAPFGSPRSLRRVLGASAAGRSRAETSLS